MNKKKSIILLFIVLLFPIVLAADTPTAGISPDNTLLWRIDILIERIDVSITGDSAKKIDKELSYAAERLAETEKMFRWEKQSGAENAGNRHKELLDKIQERVIELEKRDAEKELEDEINIEARIMLYETESSFLYQLLEESAITEEQKTFAASLIAANQESIQKMKAEIVKKREETRVRLRANGLSEEEITALETRIYESLKEETDVQEDLTQEIVQEIANTSQNASIETNETLEISAETAAVVEDTSTKSTVRIDGDVTSEQLELIAAVYEQLEREGITTEIEITVLQMENGYWKIEKEIDGTLSEIQEEKIDALVVSLQQNTAYSRIKIKYDAEAGSTSGFATGSSDDGIETTVVIG